MRVASLLGLLLVLLLGAGPVVRADEGADEDDGRTFRRENLLRQAESKVGHDPDLTDAGAVDSLKRALAADIQFLVSYTPESAEEERLLNEFQKTVQERVLFLGQPASGTGEAAVPATVGAIQEARLLYGWLVGRKPCHVWIVEHDHPFEEGRAHAYPPEKKAEEPAHESRPKDAGGEGLGPVPMGPPPPQDSGDGGGGADPTAAEPKPVKPGEQPAPDSAAAQPEPAEVEKSEPLTVDTWAQDIVLPAEGGSLLGKALAPAKCGAATSLERAAQGKPVYVDPDVKVLSRHALIAKDVFSYNAPFAALRILQANMRNKAAQGDRPPASLTSESMVQEKKSAIVVFKEDHELRVAQRQAVVDYLDRMVLDRVAWNEQAANLLQEIEDLKRRLEPYEPKEETETPAGEGEPTAEDGADEDGADEEPESPPAGDPAEERDLRLRLKLAEARESLVNLELTLLYLSAVRAKARIHLLDRLVRAAEEETAAATETHTRYQKKLVQLRNERRLDNLQGAAWEVKSWIKALADESPEAGSVYALRLDAYRALLDVYSLVEDAVVTRRRVTGQGQEEEGEPEPRPVDVVSVVGNGKAAPASESHKKHVSDIVARPQSATWDVKYIQIAAREVVDPDLVKEFDAALLAAHYASADDQIRKLANSLRHDNDEERLRPSFEEAVAKARAALEPLANDRFTMRTRRIPRRLDDLSQEFETATEGIREEREHNRERLDALLDYRALLLRQGPRSLLIRTDRDLADADVQGMVGDVSGALDQAGRWAALEGDDHVGSWLRGSWWRVGAVLVVLAVIVLLVRVGRRVLDGRIHAAAAAHPALRAEGASVKEERDEAKRRREEEELTKVETTAEDVLERTADPEDRPPDEGEGPPPTDEQKAEEAQRAAAEHDKDALAAKAVVASIAVKEVLRAENAKADGAAGGSEAQR